MWKGIASVLIWILLPWVASSSGAVIEIDNGGSNSTFRALHGINKGPLVAGGLIDLSAEFRAAGFPNIRLHDCHWPNPDVVDIHVVFPDWKAEPNLPESYDFRRTDEYIGAIRNAGAEVVYRLGESIEHTSDKRFVHPPVDMEKWAAICEGIVRHYNEGWARGFHYGIKYWEIWNEPENRPAMWSGTDEDYLRLYAATARRLKQRWPELKIGGPAVGAAGDVSESGFAAGEFTRKFLAFCRAEKLPLDFFSWHCYTDEPEEFVVRAKGIRKVLDEHGFTATESHLNEWNYLPRKDWGPVMRGSGAAERAAFYKEMAGGSGAAFVLATLLLLQDAPVDMANFFHGETGGFGLFDEHGVAQANYFAFHIFNELRSTSRILVTNFPSDGITVAAGRSADGTRIIAIAHRKAEQRLELRLRGISSANPPPIRQQRLMPDWRWQVEKVRQGPTEWLDLPEPGITVLRVPAR